MGQLPRAPLRAHRYPPPQFVTSCLLSEKKKMDMAGEAPMIATAMEFMARASSTSEVLTLNLSNLLILLVLKALIFGFGLFSVGGAGRSLDGPLPRQRLPHRCQDVVQDAQHAQIDRALLREVQQDHVRGAGGLRVRQAGERCLRQQVQLVTKIWRNIPNWPRTWKTERTKDSKPLSSEVSQGAGVFERESEKTEQKTPAPRCHSETELETRVLKPQVEKYNPGRFWKQFWKSWFMSKSSGTRELLQKIMVLKLFGTCHRRSSTGFRPTLGLSDLRFEDSEVLRSSDQGPGWSRGFWLAWQLNEV